MFNFSEIQNAIITRYLHWVVQGNFKLWLQDKWKKLECQIFAQAKLKNF